MIVDISSVRITSASDMEKKTFIGLNLIDLSNYSMIMGVSISQALSVFVSTYCRYFFLGIRAFNYITAAHTLSTI